MTGHQRLELELTVVEPAIWPFRLLCPRFLACGNGE